ncbi:virion structural protein [Erwinia phage Derbicus]|uniref:Virion structural protein n=2 Tax=Derbicusvirus derbicus TaxID=2734104 RepID=A0A1B2ICJ0_9CAUD|nr:virion structural protein [Erwinia phage vB_EamM_EarlPhillipIV]YP_009821183.1 virion structural protein [Erwinia phage Derbicus]ANZ48988.1 hypothetical protein EARLPHILLIPIV_139 [Erwinia phage vB_EamM_EarlPhillipIV]QBP07565.1 putative virion structural protein [Erwinia phage Derbicus]
MKPLNKTSDLLVLDLINEANVDADLDLTKVILLPPVDNDEEGADRNSKLTVKARKNSGFIKTQDVTYDRLQGEALFRNIAAYLDVKLPTSSTDLLDQLNKQYGLKIQAEDIVPAPIAADTNPPLTDPEEDAPPAVQHVITFKDDCYAFKGAINVLIGERPQVGERLSLVITKTKLDGLQYPDGKTDEKGQAYIYSYGTDCTAIMGFLSKLAVGTPLDDTATATELNKVFPEEWVAVAGTADYNLTDADVIYAGSTTETVQDPNDPQNTITQDVPGADMSFNSIVKLKLSDSACANFQGELFLHYNA